VRRDARGGFRFFEAVAHPAKSKDAKIMARPLGSKNNPNRKPLPFRQREVSRAIRSVQATGLPISGVDIDPRSGKISITTGSPTSAGNSNPWDEVLTSAEDKKRIA
jgi:hypothetical protein